MKKTVADQSFHVRLICLFLAFCICFTFIIYRIISLNGKEYSLAGSGQWSKTLTVGTTRGMIYDINLRRLVNEDEKKIALAMPYADSIAFVTENNTEEYKAVADSLSRGFPCLFEAEKAIQCDGIEVFSIPERYSDSPLAAHIIGYTDSEGKGAAGIEKAYDQLLTSGSGELSVSLSLDANGRALNGISPKINNNNFNSARGVVLTIDKEIQKISETAMEQIESGACVILDCETGGISACVSTPAINPKDLASAIDGENSPFINKAFASYSVGSVFKPILAAYAIENGIEDKSGHSCEGSINIDGTVFGCINRRPHGDVDLRKSLQVSCNTYYINLTKEIDSDILSSFCSNFYFGIGTEVAPGMYSDDGYLPDGEELESSGSKANFSFGQGKLTATPLQMAAAYLALIDGGTYKFPYLVAGTVDSDGRFTESEIKPPSKAISKSTSNKLREILRSVVTEGNAYYGEAQRCTVGGKTGTAQSGSYDENGKEILRTWFVGFFPANEPLYVVSVLDEDGTSGGKDCGPVFSEIADGIMELLIERANS